MKNLTAEQQVVVGLAVVQTLVRVIAARGLAFLTGTAAIGLFAWALAAGGWTALACAGAFAILVYLPALLRATAHEAPQ